MTTNQAELDKLINELNECVDGRRGWVSLTKARAKKIGVAHNLILGCAKAVLLDVYTHGQYGWCAGRPAKAAA